MNFKEIHSNTEFLSTRCGLAALSTVCQRVEKVKYNISTRWQTSRKWDKFRILRAGAVSSTCYETVHCTVSPKFTREFGATCLLCFAQFTPPSKRRKAPKMARTRCPCHFSNPSECNKLHPPPFAREAKMSFKFGVPEKRKLFGERRKEWSVYYKFLKIYSNTEFLSTRCGLAALSTVCQRVEKVKYNISTRWQTSRKWDKFRILRAGAVSSTCYETVHCTVSPKFTREFGATCLLCFAQFTPPSKRRKAPKMARTRCPCHFSNPSECNKLHPPPFAREAKMSFKFGVPEKRKLFGGEEKGMECLL